MDRLEITKAALRQLKLNVERSIDSGGTNIPIHCPFHSDRTASMYVNMKLGVYNCFQCGRGGSIEALYKEITGESLHKFLGICSDDFSASAYGFKPLEKINYEELDPSIKLIIKGEMASYKASPEAIGYLRRRGVSFKVADQLKFRYGSNIRINGTLFKERLLIPIYEKGRLVSVEGRDLTGEAKPKVLYPKGSTVNTLFEIDSLDYSKPVFIVEGLMDLAILRACPEFANSTAVFGANITQRQLYHLQKFPEVIIIPDNDVAGDNTIEILRESKLVNPRLLKVPKDIKGTSIKDVGDVVAKAHIPLQNLIDRKWLTKIKDICRE